MPTFQFFNKTNKIDEFKGADANKLQQKIQQHAATYASASASTSTGTIICFILPLCIF